MTAHRTSSRVHRRWRAYLGALMVAGAPVLLAGAAESSSLLDEPLSLRLGLAFDRGSAYTDAVGLSASAAYPYGSSVNPAAGDVLREPPNNFTLVPTITGNYVAFTGGAAFTVGAASAGYRPPGSSGTLIVSYARVDSHDAVTHQDDRLALAANQVNVSYSHLLARWISIGGALRLSGTTLRFTSTELDFPLRTETDSLGIEGTLGAFGRLGDHWSFGAQVGLGWTHHETTGRIEFPDDFGGPFPIDFHDNTKSVNIRVGIGWRPWDSLGVYADGQYLRLLNVRSGAPDNAAEVGRVFIGIEYMPLGLLLALRVGGSVDTDRQVNISTGIGFYPSRYFQAELAYVYNAFPEVRKEFGRAHLISASLSMAF